MSPRVRDAAEEPSAAAGPHGTFVAAWIQDLADGVTAAYTTGDGKGWMRKRFPFGGCNENRDFGSDPWVSVGPDGRAWVSALEAQGVVVTSLDLNRRRPQWTAPHIFPGTARRADKPEVVADPTRNGVAYIVWSKPPFSRRDHFGTLFSQTRNGGKSWTNAVLEISRRFTLEEEVGLPSISIDPRTHGIYVLTTIPKQDVRSEREPIAYSLLRISKNRGRSWSTQKVILKTFNAGVGQGYRTAFIPQMAMDGRTGGLYAVWGDSRFEHLNYDDILFSTSTDHGMRWTKPVRLTSGPGAAFNPSVAVNSTGDVGVTYYSTRGDPRQSAKLPVDYWFVSSPDHGRHFSKPLHLAGPFNFVDAPYFQGAYPFFGDYEALPAIGRTFHPFFVMIRKGKASPDVVTTTITP